MTAMELNAELTRQISLIADDEVLMQKALSAVKRIVAQTKRPSAADMKEDLTPYTMEERHEMIDHSMADRKAGRICSSEEAHRQLHEKRPWL